MTRKDYETIATGFYRAKRSFIDQGSWKYVKDGWQGSVFAVASALENDNHLFDIDKFVAFCEEGLRQHEEGTS